MLNNIQKKNIQQYLLKVGIKPHNSGFTYLADAIEMMIDENMLKPRMSSVICPRLAKKYNTTWSRVERCIRYVISKGNKEVCEMESGEFIALAVLEIK